MTAIDRLCAKPVLRLKSNFVFHKGGPFSEMSDPMSFKPQMFASPEILCCLWLQRELSHGIVHVLLCSVKHWC